MPVEYYILSSLILVLSFINGANDNGIGIATLIGSRSAGWKIALWWAAVTTALGSIAAVFLAKGLVSAFSGATFITGVELGSVRFAVPVLAGAFLANTIATIFGFPVSTTHALFGGLLGSGLYIIYTSTVGSIHWSTIAIAFCIPLLFSPLLAGTVAFVLRPFFRRLESIFKQKDSVCLCKTKIYRVSFPVISRMSNFSAALNSDYTAGGVSIQEQDRLQVASGVEWCDNPGKRSSNIMFQISHARLLRYLHFISAGWISFARGVSDTPKIAALFLIAGSIGIGISQSFLIGLVTVSMALGGLLFAKRVTRTMAFNITGMNESDGFFTNVQTGFLVISASVLGLPVSTTQLACGSLIGLGVLRGDTRWRQIRSIGLSWLLTLPFAAVFAGIIAFIIDSMNIF